MHPAQTAWPIGGGHGRFPTARLGPSVLFIYHLGPINGRSLGATAADGAQAGWSRVLHFVLSALGMHARGHVQLPYGQPSSSSSSSAPPAVLLCCSVLSCLVRPALHLFPLPHALFTFVPPNTTLHTHPRSLLTPSFLFLLCLRAFSNLPTTRPNIISLPPPCSYTTRGAPCPPC